MPDDSPSSLVRYREKSGLDDDFEDRNYIDLAPDCIRPGHAHYRCKECGKEYTIVHGCNSRFKHVCSGCSAKWRKKIVKRYYRAVSYFREPKFMTLTYRKYNDFDPIVIQRNIWKDVKQLRRVLKDDHGIIIRSFVAAVEAPNHIHLIIDAPFIDQKIISTEWERITGDSFRVDIRQVKNDNWKMYGYLVKYIGKSNCWDKVDPQLVKGFHIVGSWKIMPELPPFPLCHEGALKRISYRQPYQATLKLNSSSPGPP